MIKLLTIVGARPQIIKAAALSRVIKNYFSDKIKEYILHTGQHYDPNMSQIFFDELDIPKPDFNLSVGSASHGVQTARMIEGIEEKLVELCPDFIVLYGDTNSTLAGAVAASKINVPIVHIEAGLRSFNKTMPEEINRILCDHTATLLFSPTSTGIKNLEREGFSKRANPPFNSNNPAIFHCGDVMYDNSLFFAGLADEKSSVMAQHRLKSGAFILATIHRDNNTDNPKRLNAIFKALNRISEAEQLDVFLPLHPRTSKLLKNTIDNRLFQEIANNSHFKTAPPVSFLDMIKLENNTGLILTDSGGVQKESYFFGKPCIILRPETEWVELVENGTAIVADADEERILNAFNYFKNKSDLTFPSIFGDGHAGAFIVEQIIRAYQNF